MTSFVSGGPGVSTLAAPAVILPDPPDVVDRRMVGAMVAEAAQEITGVCAEVQVDVKIARGAAELSIRLPIRYPMPVWQVSSVCRTHVLARMRDRLDIRVRRLDIEMCKLVEL